MSDADEKLMNECIEEAMRPDRSFNINDVERLLAVRIGSTERAGKLVRAFDQKHTFPPPLH